MSSSTLPPPPPSTSQPLSLAAAASFLAEKARSTSQLIDKTLLPPPSRPITDPWNPYPSNPSLTRLTKLSAKLLQFNQHANTLGDCLTSAASAGVADELASTLDKALTRCDQGVEVVSGQVEWLGRDDVGTDVLQLNQPGTGKGKTEVDGQVMEEYADLLIAYSRLFIFGSQIVILDKNEQAEWMAKADVDKMINRAEESAKKVLLGKSILRQL
ncbi:hypothetical protein NEUTE1DRAFT_150657 [Neurospora tetrasperma FGSC 2508]|uniref:Fungal N-terminal domain-containing protein n=1 Tax=Neurospora tetrasperma (strain FGSC 2508 / ATCC MYA-4615 / P0657) TaxID=510951 RepID=F8N2P8_NEUT8|nr:uncharacterized protein NEUTE1DRAFT_150657 [Neurospora tetrasperma FGSC 2508]EGO53312.1 hypothetical protein NEUTE1DRAFT_150657 [Neurospora tetrasperma FGSC 2508]